MTYSKYLTKHFKIVLFGVTAIADWLQAEKRDTKLRVKPATLRKTLLLPNDWAFIGRCLRISS